MSSTTPRRTPRKAGRSPVTSEAEREQALRDYKLTIEYKHLKQHSPSGVYLLPSMTSLRLFHGVIFVRRGLYANATFKFTMELPDGYNDSNTWPKITFSGWVFNPHVHENGELDVENAYPQWDPHRHYLVTVLTYLKKIFYMKTFGDDATANIEARDMSRSNPAEYRKMIEKCVRESTLSIFMNEPGSTLQFKEEDASHVALRELLKSKFKDPAMVSRSVILNCMQEAQKKSELNKKKDKSSESKDASGDGKNTDDKKGGEEGVEVQVGE